MKDITGWRTDFENMPRDGSKFLALVKGEPELVYRETAHRMCYEDDKDHFIAKGWSVEEGEPNDDIAKVSFWYSDHRYEIDGECAGIGESYIPAAEIDCWMLIHPLEPTKEAS